MVLNLFFTVMSTSFISIVFLFLVSITHRSSLDLNAYPYSSIPTSDIRVIDGDTFIINEDERVRLACINSPEANTGEGTEATNLTQIYIKNTKEITLYRLGEDLYGRTVGIAIDEKGRDLGQYLLDNGGALPNSYGRTKFCKIKYLP